MLLKKHIKKMKGVTQLYKVYVQLSGKIRYYGRLCFTKKYSEDDLIAQFPQMGIHPNDRIVVNSSMSRIGILQNGPLTLVNALKRYITEDGLIVMPTYPHRSSYTYLENYKMFNVKETPSMNGAITECFRKSDGVYRSVHPTHPLAAWGKNAKEIMKGHEKSKSMYDEYSPYKKLLDLGVKNVLIGVNLDHMIMIRIIDDLYKDYPINPYLEKKYVVPVKDYEGKIINVETTCHDPNYFGLERANMKIYPYIKDIITYGKLGKATTWVMDAKRVYDIQIECAKKGIFPFNKLRFKNEKI